jgi:ligand-binding SRPBCC domain-containing protein
MRAHVLRQEQLVPRPLDDVFPFFAEARNLERITPPWLRFRIVEAPAELGPGARLRYRLTLFGLPIRWRTEIVEWTPPRGFVDV